MESGHQLDDALRAHLRTTALNQSELARRVGRKQAWLNKYINGQGHATIDDVIRLVAVLIGADVSAISEPETRLLRAFRGLPTDDLREDAISWLQTVKNRARRSPPQSFEPTEHSPPATRRTTRGTR